MPTRRRFLMTAAALATPLPLRAAPPVELLEGRAFASAWRVTLPSGRNPERLRGRLEALLAGIDRQMSPWRSDSDVSAFNAAPKGELRLPGEVLEVARAALAVAEASGGAFDPTVGPLVARWGFGPIHGDEVPGWRGLTAGEETLAKARDGLTLDLCGIAKGWALDRMAGVLRCAGEERFLIDLGGELVGAGTHPSGRPWQVAVEDPRPGATGAAEVLRLDGVAAATSGRRAQSYALGGRSYGHIVDPRARAPVAGDVASVTVLAAGAGLADAWATALVAAGERDGPALAERLGLDALFLIEGQGGLRRILTGSFAAHLA